MREILSRVPHCFNFSQVWTLPSTKTLFLNLCDRFLLIFPCLISSTIRNPISEPKTHFLNLSAVPVGLDSPPSHPFEKDLHDFVNDDTHKQKNTPKNSKNKLFVPLQDLKIIIFKILILADKWRA